MSIQSCRRGDDDDRLIVDGRDTAFDAIDISEVMRLLGVSESSIWRAVRNDRLAELSYPQPRTARWVRAEIIRTRDQLRMSPKEALRARLYTFHPVRDYLDALTWDGTPRVNTWLTTYLGVDASDCATATGRMWLTGMVAGIYRPGCKFDYAMILEGLQGTLKS